MTIDGANKIVYNLIGETDYHHSEGYLRGFYDIAQQQIAVSYAPIEMYTNVQRGVPVTLPADFYRMAYVKGGYRKIDKTHIFIDGEGSTDMCYYAYPTPITDTTAGTTAFEIPERAHAAIPYFAAAYAVLMDSDMPRYNAFLAMYNRIVERAAAENIDFVVKDMEDL